jgi:hypothetical protein
MSSSNQQQQIRLNQNAIENLESIEEEIGTSSHSISNQSQANPV